MSKEPVQVARKLRGRNLQRRLMQFFKPENYFESVRHCCKPNAAT